MTAADWLTTVPVGEPDEDGERAQVPVALTRMTPGQIDRWAAAVNNASPEQIAEAQVCFLQHLLDEQGRELAALRETAGALAVAVEGSPRLTCEQTWEDDPCARHATRIIRISKHVIRDLVFCEAHAADLRPTEPRDRPLFRDEDLPHVPALRALRALLGRMP